MWQRKQTVFLLLAALACLATWLFPVRTFERGGDAAGTGWTVYPPLSALPGTHDTSASSAGTSEGPIQFMTYGIYLSSGMKMTDASLPVPFHILFSVMAGVLVTGIFLYKNRPRQIRVVRSAWLIVLGLGVFQFVSSNSIRAYLEQGARVESSYGISFFIPLLVIALAVLAERGIRADDKLVRSMDRLR